MAKLNAALMFTAVAVLWGIPFAFMTIALDDGASPLFVAWARVFLGAVVLFGAAWATGHLKGIRRNLAPIAVVAVCDIALPFSLIPLAQEHLASSLAGVLIATTPLFVGILAVSTATEQLRLMGWAGLAIGLAGVAAIFGLQLAGDLAAGLLALVAAFSYAVATLVVRRLDGVSAIGISATSLLIATALLTPIALIGLRTPGRVSGWTALIVLGVACTAAALALFYKLIATLGATRAALSLYLAPAFSILVGALFLDEPIGAATIVGFALILLGSWLTHRNVSSREKTTSSRSS